MVIHHQFKNIKLSWFASHMERSFSIRFDRCCTVIRYSRVWPNSKRVILFTCWAFKLILKVIHHQFNNIKLSWFESQMKRSFPLDAVRLLDALESRGSLPSSWLLRSRAASSRLLLVKRWNSQYREVELSLKAACRLASSSASSSSPLETFHFALGL